MGTPRLPQNVPRPTLQEFRANRVIRKFDDLGIWFGINPPCIDAREMALLVSDTPHTIYPYLRRAFRRLEPAWIIHTGDFVDNIKLELRPKMLDLYKKQLQEFISIFNDDDYGAILVAGNHDHIPTLLELGRSDSFQIWTRPGHFSLGNFTFCAGHTYEDVRRERPADFNLYGHNLEHRTECTESGPIYLNGMQSIYLIHIYTGGIISLPYPPGTDAARLQHRRFSM